MEYDGQRGAVDHAPTPDDRRLRSLIHLRRCLLSDLALFGCGLDQYSSASMMVMTRSVTDGSVGSGE